jgi:hypothetical protein
VVHEGYDAAQFTSHIYLACKQESLHVEVDSRIDPVFDVVQHR